MLNKVDKSFKEEQRPSMLLAQEEEFGENMVLATQLGKPQLPDDSNETLMLTTPAQWEIRLSRE